MRGEIIDRACQTSQYSGNQMNLWLVLPQSEDLLWNDYEEKLSDQIVRTMENYTSQFPEVKVVPPSALICTLLSKKPS